jgi:hypothetical protein
LIVHAIESGIFLAKLTWVQFNPNGVSAQSNLHKQQPVLRTYKFDIARSGENFSRIRIKMNEKELDEPG